MSLYARAADSIVAVAIVAAAAAVGLGSIPDAWAQAGEATPVNWFCPMHPDEVETEPGACGRCGMTLVPGNPWDEREYILELRTDPPAPRTGEPVRLTFTVRDPDSREVVKGFEVVHDKRYHLFVASQDLEHFEHIHPEQQPDGSWTIEVTLSKPGFYRTYSDFLPTGGTPQVIGRTFATAGFEGDLSSSIARLEPDRSLVKKVGDTTVRLTLEPDVIVAGRVHRLVYSLEANGEPVTDLEPYLAAWGHTLVLSDDALEYVHAHPIEYLPLEYDEGIKGGPDVTFDGRFPRPGRYRIWTQFQRGGEVSTVFFTVEAVSAYARR